jgi:diguanylate cyclase (GGDEF)-like protein
MYTLTADDLASLGAPDDRKPWQSGIGVRLDDGSSTLGWISIGRGTDNNPSPFDDIDLKMFSLLAGVVSGFLARGMLISAVAERDEQATHLRYRAMHDGLTKVLAGHEFRAELAKAATSQDPGRKVLIFIDLDGFKPINDRYGHAAGDAVLIQVAARLRQSVRAHDVVGRMGGDEFAVLASLEGASQADDIARRLLLEIERPVEYLGESLCVSASIGMFWDRWRRKTCWRPPTSRCTRRRQQAAVAGKRLECECAPPQRLELPEARWGDGHPMAPNDGRTQSAPSSRFNFPITRVWSRAAVRRTRPRLSRGRQGHHKRNEGCYLPNRAECVSSSELVQKW